MDLLISFWTYEICDVPDSFGSSRVSLRGREKLKLHSTGSQSKKRMLCSMYHKFSCPCRRYTSPRNVIFLTLIQHIKLIQVEPISWTSDWIENANFAMNIFGFSDFLKKENPILRSCWPSIWISRKRLKSIEILLCLPIVKLVKKISNGRVIDSIVGGYVGVNINWLIMDELINGWNLPNLTLNGQNWQKI